MATKQQIRKYINNIHSCNRIEVFSEPDMLDASLRWIHFISRKGEFIGFTISSPESPLDNFVKYEKRYMTSKLKMSDDVADPSNYTLRRSHLKKYQLDGVIIRKNGKWTWVK